MALSKRIPVEGGWGWMVVLTSCYFHLVGGGAVYALSVFYNSWVEDFEASRGLTAWVLILVMAVSMGTGPIVASICSKFGNRPVVIFGALLLSAGFFGSCFAQSVYVLIGLIGLLGGFGKGLQYLPCMAMIPLYFEKKRSFATGLATSGVGLGTFIFPPILTWLEECYTWRGAMLIISGLLLNMVVGGALLRPIDIQEEEEEYAESEEKSKRFENYLEDNISLENGEKCRPNGTTLSPTKNYSKRYTEVKDGLLQCKETYITKPYEIKVERVFNEGSELPKGDPITAPSNGYSTNVHEIQIMYEANMKSTGSLHNDTGYDHARSGSQFQHPAVIRARDTTKSLGGSFQQLKPTAISHRFASAHDLNHKPCSKTSSLHIESGSSAQRHKRCHISNPSKLHTRSYVDILLSNSIVNLEKADQNHRYIHSRPQCHNSISVSNTKYYPALLTQSDQTSHKLSLNFSACESHNSVHTIDSLSCQRHLESVTQITYNQDTPSHGSKCFPDSPAIISKNLDLLLDPRFGIFAFANFLACFTYLVPVVYIVDRGIDQGLEKTQAALAFSMYGAGNLFGRLGSGLVADTFRLDCLTFEACLLIVCGISTCLSTLCGASIILHGIYGAVFGTCIGGFVTLTPVILVEMLGVAKVSQSYGLLLFFQAAGFIAGTPMGGFIYDATHSYTLSFLINGSIIGLSGVVLIILKLTFLQSQRQPDTAYDKSSEVHGLEGSEADIDTDKDIDE